MKYDVTIGIPVYKAVDYIEKTMESALNQTFGSVEYLVVDDCGNDGSIEVVERLQKEHQRGKDIRILHNNQNLGVGKTRNVILEEAKGEYLYFLDSDDIMEHDAIYSTFLISVCNVLFSLNLIQSNHLHFIDTIYWEDLAFTYDMVPLVNRAVLLSAITYQYLCRSGSLSNYQEREQLNKSEILRNALTLDYLKRNSITLSRKSYFPYLYYNLETNSFYMVCYILKNYKRITPLISESEMIEILRYPISVWKIIRFRHRIFLNLIYCALSHLPLQLSLFVVKFLGKMKKVI